MRCSKGQPRSKRTFRGGFLTLVVISQILICLLILQGINIRVLPTPRLQNVEEIVKVIIMASKMIKNDFHIG